jgi:hypothetical protein
MTNTAGLLERLRSGLCSSAALPKCLSRFSRHHLALTFDGLNLNNPVLKYYFNSVQPQAFYSNERQYFLGTRMSLQVQSRPPYAMLAA